MPPIRASRLPLLTKCSGSLFIQHADPDDADQTATLWGHLAHHWKEHGEIDSFHWDVPRRTRNAFLRAVRLSGINRETLWPRDGHHETSVAVSVDGTRKAVFDRDREYVGREGWITGTADFFWRVSGQTLWVDDLKTGKLYPNPPAYLNWHDPRLQVGENRFPQDPNSPQIRFYLLGIFMAATAGGDTLIQAVPSITHWPRLPVTARHTEPERIWGNTISRRGLLNFWEQLEEMYERPKVVPGPHCRFCPARVNCTAAEQTEES